MSLLENASDKRTIKNASWALANLAKSNADNKAAIRKAKGIQVVYLEFQGSCLLHPFLPCTIFFQY